MPTVRENLIAAKALIDTPEKWVKGSFEKNGCYCASGAVADIPDVRGRVAALEALRHALPIYGAVFDFNDDPDTTHADIMALFDRAIAASETK